MRWGVVLLVICAVARGQDGGDEEDEGFPLTEAQIAQCEPVGYFADPDDCCRFIQCDYYSEGDETYNVGHNVACMGGSVWNSEKCTCEEPNDDNPCNPATCDVPEFISVPCPTAGLEADQCCIDGIIHQQINDTSYRIIRDDGPDNDQTCPFELLFDFDDCCCDDELFEGIPPMCDHYKIDDIPFADEGVIASGAVLVAPGAAGSDGAASFSAGTAAGAASAKLSRWSNVDVGKEFSAAMWVKVEGDGASQVFHNGAAGGQGATIGFELSKTSGGGYAVSGGVFGQDSTSDFYEQVDWQEGSWHFVGMSYKNGELSVYLDDEAPASVNESEELDNEPVVQLFKSAAEEAIESVDNAAESVRRRATNIGADGEGFSEVQGVLDCIEQIKRDLEDNKEYIEDIQRGLSDFRSKRKVYRRAYNKFKKPRRRDDDSRDDLQAALNDVEAAFNLLNEKVQAICAALDKVCDILGNKDILKQLDSGSKKELKKLKRKLGKLKGKFEDDNPGDRKFGLRGVDETFPKAREFISEYNSGGRKKRQAEEEEEEEEVRTSIYPSKYPITIGEDFNGSIDEVFVCDFFVSEEQMNAIRESRENPIMPMS